MRKTEPESLLSYQQLAAKLGLKPNTLAVLVHRKQVPHFRLAKRLVRFDPIAVERWLASKQVAALP
jgi:excisionase family DNA binding protein